MKKALLASVFVAALLMSFISPNKALAEARHSQEVGPSGEERYTPLADGEHNFTFDSGHASLTFDAMGVDLGSVVQKMDKGLRDIPSKDGSHKGFQISVKKVVGPGSRKGVSVLGDTYQFGPDKLVFKGQATITLPYACPEDITEDMLGISCFDEERQEWTALPVISRDPVKRNISAMIRHFSSCAVTVPTPRVDEAGSLKGLVSDVNTNVDPYYGALVLSHTDVGVPARGVPLALDVKFNSDYAYDFLPSTGTFPSSSGNLCSSQKNNVAYEFAKGWSYQLPYCSAGISSFIATLAVTTPEGVMYDLSDVLYGFEYYPLGYQMIGGKTVNKTSDNSFSLELPETGAVWKFFVEYLSSGGSAPWPDAFLTEAYYYYSNGSYAEFYSSGLVSSITDSSGKNSVVFHYDADGNLTQMIHTDGRYIDFVRYSIYDYDYIVTLLSRPADNSEHEEIQFICRKVINNNTKRLLCEQVLDTDVPRLPSGYDLRFAEDDGYIHVLNTTSFEYSLSATAQNDYIAITMPGGSYKKFLFEPSFHPDGEVLSCDAVSGQTVGYRKTYQNKPKVKKVIKAPHRDSLQYELTEYIYSAPNSIQSFSASHVSYSPSTWPTGYNTKPQWTSYTRKRHAASTSALETTTLNFSHSSTTKQYLGVASVSSMAYADETRYSTTQNTIINIPNGHAVSCEKNMVFNEELYYLYMDGYGILEDLCWDITNTYDSHGRLIKSEDSRKGASYSYFLIDGTTNGRFAYPYSTPSGVSLEKAFAKVAGTAIEQKAGVYAIGYNEYDAALNVASSLSKDVRAFPNTTNVDSLTSYTYDPATNNLTTVISPTGGVQTYTYGSGIKSSFPIKVSKPLGANGNQINAEYAATCYDYDLWGRVIQSAERIQDANGTDIVKDGSPIATNDFTYDGLGRITQVKMTVNGASTVLLSRCYDDTNRIVTNVDAKGFITKTTYNSYYMPIGVSTFIPDNDARDATYSGAGKTEITTKYFEYDYVYPVNVTKEITPLNNTRPSIFSYIDYSYDALGRLKEQSRTHFEEDGNVCWERLASVEYDDINFTKTEKRYQSANVYSLTQENHDLLGRTTSKTVWAGNNGTGTTYTTSYSYDYQGRVVGMTLPNAESYAYSFSPAGLLERLVYPQIRGEEHREYDARGLLTKRKDAAGNEIAYTYNPAYLETSQTASALGKETIAITTTYSQYGPNSITQTRAASPEMAIMYNYDGAGRVVSETRTIGNGSSSKTATKTHAYDAAGNLKGIGVTGFSGYSKSIEYSTPYFGGRMLGVYGNSYSTALNASGATVARAAWYNGWASLEQVDYVLSGKTTQYPTYDMSLSRPLIIDNPDTAFDQSMGYDRQGNVISWNSSSYMYDGLNRLSGPYTYDIIGNISAGPSASYVYDLTTANKNSMQLASATINGIQRSITDDDTLGNIVSISDRLTGLTYDAYNNLVTINDAARLNGTNPSDVYAYDPFGTRYSRVERGSDGSETKTLYIYEGVNILYSETWRGGACVKNDFNLFIAGKNVGRYTKSGGAESLQYFYTDHLGSRRAVTNSSGSVLAKIDYSVWGIPTVTNYNGYNGSQDISYTGKDYDATKLYYFNARYYDPSMGRFLTEDPVRDEMNWYAYCGNNPLSFTDPTGLTVPKEEGEISAKDKEHQTAVLLAELDKDHDGSITASDWGSGGSGSGTPTPTPEPKVTTVIPYQKMSIWDRIGYAILDFFASDPAEESLWNLLTGQGTIGDGLTLATSAIPVGGNGLNAAKNVVKLADRIALEQLAVEAAKRGMTKEEAKILVEWAQELGTKGMTHAPHPYPSRIDFPHAHIGGQDHIPIQ